MNPFRVWRSVVVCIVALATGAAIQGCPQQTPCPCEGEQEGEGQTPRFDIVGNFAGSNSDLLPWDTRTGNQRVGTYYEIDFFANGRYSLAFRENDIVVASEDGSDVVNLDAGPPTLDLTPENASYSGGPYSSAQNQKHPNLAVVETRDSRYLNIGFKGGNDDWGDLRPAGYAVSDLRLELIRKATKSNTAAPRLSDYLRAMGW